MQEKTENRHMVDILFVLTLFCVFALCALTLVTLGANVYQRTVDHMESNFESRTPTSYITQKVRQADWENGVYVTQFDGIEALLMKQTIQETEYYTYIYEYEGYLCELFTRADLDMSASAGNQIVPIRSFHVAKENPHLISLDITTDNRESLHFTICTRSRNEEDS